MSHVFTLRTRLFVALLLLFCACGDSDGNQVSVVVVTGLVPGAEFTRVVTELYVPTQSMENEVAQYEAAALFGAAFSRGVKVATFADVPEGDVLVRVRALTPAGLTLVAQAARASIERSSTIRIVLDRDCIDVTCPSTGGSAALAACLQGQCVDPRCIPSDPSTREFCPDITFCNNVSECDPVAQCATQECVDGLCITSQREADANDPTTCSESSWCNPTAASDACQPVVNPMSAVDAGTPLCGSLCFPESDACRVGFWICSPASAPICTGLTTAPVGSRCAQGVCNSTGECVDSLDGGTPIVDASIDADDASTDGEAEASVDSMDAEIMSMDMSIDAMIGETLDAEVVVVIDDADTRDATEDLAWNETPDAQEALDATLLEDAALTALDASFDAPPDTPLCFGPPAKPQLLQGVRGCKFYTAKWAPDADATSYTVSFVGRSYHVANAAQFDLPFVSEYEGVEYSSGGSGAFYVVANNACGHSEPAVGLAGAKFFRPPYTLTMPGVDRTCGTAVGYAFSWGAVSYSDPATHAVIDVSTSTDFSTFVLGWNARSVPFDRVNPYDSRMPGVQFFVQGLPPGDTYYVRVRVADDEECLSQPATYPGDLQHPNTSGNYPYLSLVANARTLNLRTPLVASYAPHIGNTCESFWFDWKQEPYDTTGCGLSSDSESTLKTYATVATNATSNGHGGYTLDAQTILADWNNVELEADPDEDGFSRFEMNGDPDVRYYVQLISSYEHDSMTESSAATTFVGNTSRTIPSAVTANATSGSNCSSINFNWSAVAGAYYLDIATDSAFEHPLQSSSGQVSPSIGTTGTITWQNVAVGGNTSITVSGLPASTTYYYRVRTSATSCGDQGTSGTKTVATCLPVPSTPTAYSGTDPTCGGFRAHWTPSTYATSYSMTVYVIALNTWTVGSVVSGWNDVDIGMPTDLDSNPNTMEFDLTGLSGSPYGLNRNGTTYFYSVKARNSSGASSGSNPNNAMGNTLSPAPPNAPVANAASAIDCTSFRANWSASDYATGYYVDVSTTSDFSSYLTNWQNKSAGNVTQVLVSNQTMGATYYYRIRAANSCGTTTSSSTRSVTLNNIPVLTSCPSNIAVSTDQDQCNAFVSYPQAQATGSPWPEFIYSKSSGTQFSVGTTTVDVTVYNSCGSATTACSFDVTVTDDQAPTIICPSGQYPELDETCHADLLDYRASAPAWDNCDETVNLVQTPDAETDAFSQTSIGLNTISLSATDSHGNDAIGCSFDLYVGDYIPPTTDHLGASSNAPYLVPLDENGVASVSAADIDDGSTDNCGFDSYYLYSGSQEITGFDCNSVGDQQATFETRDINDNRSYSTVYFRISDDIDPTIVAQDVTLYLDETGAAYITANDNGSGYPFIDNGSYDACGISSYYVTQEYFDCWNVGTPVQVTFEVTDNNGNAVQTTASVTVTDSSVPLVYAQDITVYLDENGAAFAAAYDDGSGLPFADAGSYDPCYFEMTLSQTAFDCSHLGGNTVTFTATDASSNTDGVDIVVTVEDPLGVCG